MNRPRSSEPGDHGPSPSGFTLLLAGFSAFLCISAISEDQPLRPKPVPDPAATGLVTRTGAAPEEPPAPANPATDP